MTGTIRTIYKTETLTGDAAIFATLRPPMGKSTEQHLRDLATFWSPDSAPHQLARAALVAIEAERLATAAAMAEVKRLRRELAAVCPTSDPRTATEQALADRQMMIPHELLPDYALDPDSLAAELEPMDAA